MGNWIDIYYDTNGINLPDCRLYDCYSDEYDIEQEVESNQMVQDRLNRLRDNGYEQGVMGRVLLADEDELENIDDVDVVSMIEL